MKNLQKEDANVLEKFIIFEPGNEPVGYLTYDENKEEYIVYISKEADPNEMPLLMMLEAKTGNFIMSPDLSRAFLQERIIPSNRQNIAQILADLGYPYYDMIFFLRDSYGRCVMDDFVIMPEKQYEIEKTGTQIERE